jgi:hypothetical protein
MFLLRKRRPARYGRCIEISPPREPTEDARRFALTDALIEMDVAAPAEHGNRLEDRSGGDEDEA